ncbi:transposase [Glaesserella sp.]|uniref:transposase n=1 Tax=Glaesserella sp. TaxID=2094731 RepID=UPI0035A03BD0
MDKPQRKIIRLQHYDYSQVGLYFITICVQDRLCVLSNIRDEQYILTSAGRMVEYWYLEIASHFSGVRCLDYIIMPNHIHFILFIEKGLSHSLFKIIQWFKTITTNHYIKNVKENNWQPFNKKLWQRSYYEHIIRNEQSYLQICDYMRNNPYSWKNDALFTE